MGQIICPIADILFDFLLQIVKQVRLKEILNGDSQTIAELFYG